MVSEEERKSIEAAIKKGLVGQKVLCLIPWFCPVVVGSNLKLLESVEAWYW